MKKGLKIILWTIPAVIFIAFTIALMILDNSDHGRLYKGTAKMYDDNGSIIKVEVSFEFHGDDELKSTMKKKGQVITNEYLCIIDDGDLYLMDGYLDYIGEIDAYEIEIGNAEDGMVIHDLKCSKNIILRNVFVSFIVLGILGLFVNAGFVVFNVLKKKGIIKIRKKTDKEINDNDEKNIGNVTEENE